MDDYSLNYKPWLDPAPLEGLSFVVQVNEGENRPTKLLDSLLDRCSANRCLDRSDLEKVIQALDCSRRQIASHLKYERELKDIQSLEISSLLLGLQVALVQHLQGGSPPLLERPSYAATNYNPELWRLRFEALAAVFYLKDLISVSDAEKYVFGIFHGAGVRSASNSALSEWRSKAREVYPENFKDKDLAEHMPVIEKLCFDENEEWRILDFANFVPKTIQERCFNLGKAPTQNDEITLPMGWYRFDDDRISDEKRVSAVKKLVELILAPIAERAAAYQ